MSLENVVDILVSQGVGGAALRQYADANFGVIDSETGQRDSGNTYDHSSAPDAQDDAKNVDPAATPRDTTDAFSPRAADASNRTDSEEAPDTTVHADPTLSQTTPGE